MAWSPNNQRLAVATADRLIHLFDETGERKDRFPTKAADPKVSFFQLLYLLAKNSDKRGMKTTSYSIVGLAWSPDSTRLAIAQSDAVVFVYKLGLEWGEKKSICNKLIQSVDVSSLTWPREQHNALVFGLTDGKAGLSNSFI